MVLISFPLLRFGRRLYCVVLRFSLNRIASQTTDTSFGIASFTSQGRLPSFWNSYPRVHKLHFEWAVVASCLYFCDWASTSRHRNDLAFDRMALFPFFAKPSPDHWFWTLEKLSHLHQHCNLYSTTLFNSMHSHRAAHRLDFDGTHKTAVTFSVSCFQPFRASDILLERKSASLRRLGGSRATAVE